MDKRTADALLHLLRIASEAGQHTRTTSMLKPDEAALLAIEIARLREQAGEVAPELAESGPTPPVRRRSAGLERVA